MAFTSRVSTKRASTQLRARQVLAQRIREVRAARGLSQEALASKCGLHRTYIGAVERAERNVSIDNIERIAVALGCAIPELLEGGR
jgi:Predicted transcriptional regulators